MITIYEGDCIEIMRTLPTGSVDAIITDLPYGTTHCSWDSVIPLKPMWQAVERILKPGGVFVTTAAQPFTTTLIASNPDWFRYDWVWDKRSTTGVANVKHRPLKQHESILVFSQGKSTYNPQLHPENTTRRMGRHVGGPTDSVRYDMAQSGTNIGYPKSILSYPRPNNLNREGGLHPTQKPVALYEYLILTYTNPGDTVLDFCAGSGTTGAAALQAGRNAILIENDRKYINTIQKRITENGVQPKLLA